MVDKLGKDAIIRILESMVAEAYLMGRLDYALDPDNKWDECIVKEQLEDLLDKYWEEDDLI
jgi:hypothetical protein